MAKVAGLGLDIAYLIVVAWITFGYQAIKATLVTPVKSLKPE